MKAHLINCTYCTHRQVSSDPKSKNNQFELCKLNHRKIPHPNQPGRFCEDFHQEGHDCASCWSN